MAEVLLGCGLGLVPLAFMAASGAWAAVVEYLQEVQDQSEHY